MGEFITKFIEVAKTKIYGFHYSLNTNLTPLNKDRIDFICENYIGTSVSVDYIIDNEISLFKSWIIYLKRNKEKYYFNSRRVTLLRNISSEYPELLNLISKAGLKWEPDLDYEYRSSEGMYSKYIIIKE